MADLRTDLGKIVLKNPVMTASGTFGYGREYHEFFDIARLGAVVVKGTRRRQSHAAHGGGRLRDAECHRSAGAGGGAFSAR